MIIVADSGSTKTTWQIWNQGRKRTVRTSGINPFYLSQQEIEATIERELVPKMETPDQVKELFYYGAGLSNEQRKRDLAIPLHFIFRNAVIEVEHDLLGAARSLLGEKQGIACIAGTGSNSCLFDGKNIVQNIESLGLYMGDEGSGGFKGKSLITAYLREELPENIRLLFEETFLERKAEIMDTIYRKPFPNRYLASFMPFITMHQKDAYIKQLIRTSFGLFFENCISKYPGWETLKINFIGSVAFHLQKILKEVAKEKGFRIGAILQDPLEGLADYHFKENGK